MCGQLHPVARALLAETGLLETIRVNIFASIVARAVELVHATAEARDLVEAYRPPADPATRWQTRPGRAAWATEAPGRLCFHRHEIDDGGHIAACQIVPPTSQNQPAIDACLDGRLARIIVISSTMVYESARVSSTPEGTERTSPPPLSTYGFQKLATEYFARGAWEQYRLPYTIVRPSSPVGRSERRALLDLSSEGSVPRKLFTNHAVPDLVIKILSGEDPLHLSGEGTQMRNYIAARDLARGIRLAMELPEAANDDFNLGTAKGISILELSQRIWSRIHGNDRPFHYTSDTDYRYDVPYRVPDVRKAKAILGFEAKITLDEMLDEVFGWIREEMDAGTLTPATRA